MFSCEFCEIFKNSFFAEHLWTTASVVGKFYSGIFRHIQRHSAIFSHVQAYQKTLRQIQALLWNVEPYSDIFRTLCNLCIYNRIIFRTLAYLEAQPSLKAYQTCKMIRHNPEPWHGQNRNIELNQSIKSFSKIFRDIQGFWCIINHTQALFSLQNAPFYSAFWIRLCLDNCSVIYKMTLWHVQWKF